MNTQILCVSITVLIFGCGLITQGAKQPKIFAKFTKLKCVNLWPELLQIHCHVNLTGKNESALYSDMTFSEDLKNITGNYSIAIEREHKFVNYVTIEMDYCSALLLGNGQSLIEIIAYGFRRVSNFPLGCPLKKNETYFINGYTIDPKLIPVYLPEISFRTNATFFYKKRQIFYSTAFGRVVRK